MFTTTTPIILAILLALAIRKAWRLHRHCNNLRDNLRDSKATECHLLTRAHQLEEQAATLRATIDRWFEASCHGAARYHIITTDSGTHAVYRLVQLPGGHSRSFLVHRFTDTDPDFNRLQAEELCDNLNSLT